MKNFCFSISYLWGVKEKGALSKNKQKYLPTQETTISVKMKLWNAKITQTSKQVADVHIVPSVFNWKNTRELIMNDLKKFMETVILRLENEGRYGTAHVYQSTLNAILRYWQIRQKGTIKLDKVFTPVLLQDFWADTIGKHAKYEHRINLYAYATGDLPQGNERKTDKMEAGIVRHRIHRRTGRHQTITDCQAHGKYTCGPTITPLTKGSTVMVHSPVSA